MRSFSVSRVYLRVPSRVSGDSFKAKGSFHVALSGRYELGQWLWCGG